MIGINLNKTKESLVTIVFRILMNYIQVITTVISLNLSFPKIITDLYKPFTTVESSSSMFLSFDCLMRDMGFEAGNSM